MRGKRMVGAFALVLALAVPVAGCARTQEEGPVSMDQVEDDSKKETSDKTIVTGWLPDAVAYCKDNPNEKDVLVEITGMIAKGSSANTVSTITLIDPSELEPVGEGVDEYYEVKPGDTCAEVFFKEPIEITRWTHLTTVRGKAHLDPTQENKIVIEDAEEVEY